MGERTKDLGFLLKEKGDFPGAEAALRRALAIFENIGDQHFQVGICRKGIGWLYLEMGRSEEADEELRRALAILEESLPGDHWNIAETRSLLGASLVRRGRFEEAEPLLISGFELLAGQRGTGHKRTRGALERVVDLYESWGRDEKAAEYRELRAAESG